ncbi:MAG: DUF4124 domain-containing protein [Nitrosomonas sp.]|nr:DUF4124 domain-containing protein [Nitrosomonas sp.]MBP6075299.1 DUF4124 domain-containing protein [Nitrosomonas sp.]
MKIRTLFIVLILSSSLSHAIAGTDIYKHVDKDGNITFTNRRINNAQKVSIASFSRNTVQSGSSSQSLRVKDTTQKERDTMRRQILEKELMTEEKLFSDTQSSLLQVGNHTESSLNQEKIVQLKNKLFSHQRNIAALKKELAKL